MGRAYAVQPTPARTSRMATTRMKAAQPCMAAVVRWVPQVVAVVRRMRVRMGGRA